MDSQEILKSALQAQLLARDLGMEPSPEALRWGNHIIQYVATLAQVEEPDVDSR